jgi:hypothetical protein
MAIQGEYDPKKDLGATIRFLSSIQEKTSSFVQHLDMQANVIIGISMAVFAVSFSRISAGDESVAPYILSVCSALSAIAGLYAVHPPKFMRKRGQSESLLYNKSITETKSAENYQKQLESVIGNSDEIVRQYALEIYNMAAYYYRPKRDLFKLSRNLFLIGIVLGLLSLFIF